ncbi:uncharacterized protein PHALS_11441 [Plasmopara halstedii]|uniref:RxLR-like protein n=1 Tax=Plasmopara halstedii TaxID=4781 RepID=A0A0P1A4W1_PLAHL|nr:uncharacterized protein PHALS_11441 [Plasmopara halstedii]CEG35567.1 hypothetical protein PHALS_11441 [Plasmopara halstedii]|eukprot:XP_024571936.1 hypothetical protein PHALS_11441 [Plasmopara halstedii]
MAFYWLLIIGIENCTQMAPIQRGRFWVACGTAYTPERKRTQGAKFRNDIVDSLNERPVNRRVTFFYIYLNQRALDTHSQTVPQDNYHRNIISHHVFSRSALSLTSLVNTRRGIHLNRTRQDSSKQVYQPYLSKT